MPTITRSRTLRADPEEVWRVVSDPEHLPRWWPQVQRVEDVTGDAWTTVLASPKGRTVRADYTLIEEEPLRRRHWRHEVEESPFERILSNSTYLVELGAGGAGETRVELTAELKLRGFARFGGIQVRRATARQLDGALEGLGHAVEEPA